MRLSRDDSGQWILLSGVIIAVGLIVLMLLLNTAMLTGHSSTESAMSFPKNDIRDLTSGSRQEAMVLAINLNNDPSFIDGDSRITNFTTSYNKFKTDMITVYTARGAVIDIQCTPYLSGKLIDHAVINVSYDNGNTKYKESMWATFT